MRRVRRTASGHNPADPQPHDGRAREAICCVGADKDIWSKIKATDFQDADEEPALEDWLQHAGAPATAVARAHTWPAPAPDRRCVRVRCSELWRFCLSSHHRHVTSLVSLSAVGFWKTFHGLYDIDSDGAPLRTRNTPSPASSHGGPRNSRALARGFETVCRRSF